MVPTGSQDRSSAWLSGKHACLEQEFFQGKSTADLHCDTDPLLLLRDAEVGPTPLSKGMVNSS